MAQQQMQDAMCPAPGTERGMTGHPRLFLKGRGHAVGPFPVPMQNDLWNPMVREGLPYLPGFISTLITQTMIKGKGRDLPADTLGPVRR